MQAGYSAYTNTTVDTADQGRLILIAYDVAIKHCKLATEAFADPKRIEERTKYLFKVQDAVSELMGSLKMDAGEIAKNLYNLYNYMLRSCIEANLKSNPAKVKEVQGYLEDLRDAWSQAIANVRRESATATATIDSTKSFALSG